MEILDLDLDLTFEITWGFGWTISTTYTGTVQLDNINKYNMLTWVSHFGLHNMQDITWMGQRRAVDQHELNP